MISTRRGKDLDPNVRNFLLSSTHYNPQMLLENNPLLSSFLSLSLAYTHRALSGVYFLRTPNIMIHVGKKREGKR